MPGAVERLELSVSFVRHRSRFRVVRKSTTSGRLYAPSSGNLPRERRTVQGSMPCRSKRSNTRRAMSSPLDHGCHDLKGLSCLPLTWNLCRNVERRGFAALSGPDSFSQPKAVLPPGRPSAVRKSMRGKNHPLRLKFHWATAMRCGGGASVAECWPHDYAVRVLCALPLDGPSEFCRCTAVVDSWQTTGSVRTRPQKGVRDEEGNVDQCPPAGGEPDRYRGGWCS